MQALSRRSGVDWRIESLVEMSTANIDWTFELYGVDMLEELMAGRLNGGLLAEVSARPLTSVLTTKLAKVLVSGWQVLRVIARWSSSMAINQSIDRSVDTNQE